MATFEELMGFIKARQEDGMTYSEACMSLVKEYVSIAGAATLDAMACLPLGSDDDKVVERATYIAELLEKLVLTLNVLDMSI
jgi:hypothetical protein